MKGAPWNEGKLEREFSFSFQTSSSRDGGKGWGDQTWRTAPYCHSSAWRSQHAGGKRAQPTSLQQSCCLWVSEHCCTAGRRVERHRDISNMSPGQYEHRTPSSDNEQHVMPTIKYKTNWKHVHTFDLGSKCFHVSDLKTNNNTVITQAVSQWYFFTVSFKSLFFENLVFNWQAWILMTLKT